MPRLLTALLALLGLLVPAPFGAPPVAHAADPAPADAVRLLVRPVDGEVVARFDAPTRYGAGHRGVDLAAPPGTEVVAPAGGTVTFAGTVVGDRWITVDHGRLRSTVGPLATIMVRAGDDVASGTALGTSGHAHGAAAVHWSVRRGDTYLDPLAAAPRVATLLPAGEPRRPTGHGPAGSSTTTPAGAAPLSGAGPWRGRVR